MGKEKKYINKSQKKYAGINIKILKGYVVRAICVQTNQKKKKKEENSKE